MMRPTWLKVTQADNKFPPRIYDLFRDRVISVETYDKIIFFEVIADDFKGRIRLEIGDTVLEPKQGFKYPSYSCKPNFKWKKPSNLLGRTGEFQNLIIHLERNGQCASHSLQLQLTSGTLDEQELKLIFDDLIYMLYLDWQSPTTVNIAISTEVNSIRPKLVLWELIQENYEQVLAAARHITIHPQTKLYKTYIEKSFQISDKLDNYTIRSIAARGLNFSENTLLDTKIPVVHTNLSSNTLENRFIAAVFSLLLNLLITLESAIDGQYKDESHKRAKALRYGNMYTVNDIEQRLLQLDELRTSRSNVQKAVQQVLSQPLFRDMPNTLFELSSTIGSLLLTQNPYYFRVFDFYTKLIAKGKSDWLTTSDRIRRHLVSIGVDRIVTIYETWAFIRIYHELLNIGFVPIPYHDLSTMIVEERLNPALYSGASRWLEMERSIPNQGKIQIRLFHEREFIPPRGVRHPDYNWRPDITLEILKGRQSWLVFLDAKYKDFSRKDNSFQGLNELHTELFASQNGIEKYLEVKNSSSKVLASFILHPTIDSRFENYGAQVPVDRKPFDLNQTESRNHEIGFLPFVPQNTSTFRKFLGMLFAVKLRFNLYCWNCHSTDVTQSSVKENHYRCQDCHTEWHINGCNRCSPSPIIIKGAEVPFQISVGRGNYKCPKCGNALPSHSSLYKK